jgi:hypothetical protein
MRCRYKDRGDKVKENLCKWLLNSLAGKFGQRSHRWEKDTEVDWPEPWGRFDIIDADTNTVKHYRSIAWLIEREQKQGEHPESFPAVAAWVTSLARVKQLKLLEVANNAGRVFYAPVDGIQADYLAYKRLDEGGYIGDELGKLRVVTVATTADYRGIANYSIDNEMHIAGLPKSCHVAPDRQLAWTHLGTDATSSNGRGPRPITEYTCTRAINPPYVHGRVNADGTTRPWILPLEETEMMQCLTKANAIGIFD